MSGMPAPAPTGFFSGASATTASVVRMFFAIDAVLLLLHLGLGRRADRDDRDAAGQLGESLLELLTVEVGVGVVDLGLQLLDPALDGLGLAGPVDDRRRVLVDDDTPGVAELRE